VRGLSLALMLAATFLVAAYSATASTPPPKPVLVTLKSIDGNASGGKTSGFTIRVKPDKETAGDSYEGTLRLWTRQGVVWAGMTQKQTDGTIKSFAYFGAFRTVKGDTNGTPLSTFLHHWPGARLYSTGASAYNVLPLHSTVLFGFNRARRLVGVTTGWGDPMFPSGLGEVGRAPIASCFYPECAWDSSPYDG
jgi:hypothetical protein